MASTKPSYKYSKVAYKRFFSEDWTYPQFKKLKFTDAEYKLFDEQEYHTYRTSEMKHLSGGYVNMSVSDYDKDYLDYEGADEDSEDGHPVFDLVYCYGIDEPDHMSKDFGYGKYDRQTKKFFCDKK